MTRFKIVFLFLLSSSLLATQPDFRLVITGALQGIHDGDGAFYQSLLFRAGDVVDNELGSLTIENASRPVWSFGDAVFYQLEQAPVRASKGIVKALIASQLYGLSIAEDERPESMPDNALRRELGGVLRDVEYEIRKLDDVWFVAVNVSNHKRPIVWPKSVSEMNETQGALGYYPKVSKHTIWFPRSTASTSRAFGIVDALLKQQVQIPTRYIDLGDALSGPDNESMESARQMHRLLMARNPVVLGASRYDLHALSQDLELFSSAPYIIGNSKTVQIVDNQVQFVAISDVDSEALGFLPKGVKPLSVTECIRLTEKSSALTDVVVGMADSGATAALAIRSPVFDFVLSLGTGFQGSLPSIDDMNLEPNLREGLSSSAPLVRVSGADVTELSVWVDAEGRVTRLQIRRHPIVGGGAEALDARAMLADFEKQEKTIEGLPTRNWIQSNLTDVLGAILLKSSPGAELAIIDEVASVTPIYSVLPMPLAEALLQRPGRAVTLSLRGKYIKRILKAAKARQINVPIALVGGSMKGPTIGKREIVDGEKYAVVVTERVLFEIDNFMSREALFASSSLASSSVQTALLEGNKDALKILSEIRKRETRDDVYVADKRKLLIISPPVSEVVRQALKEGILFSDVDRYVREAAGRAKPTLVFDIPDLDFGFKYNRINSELAKWRTAFDKGTVPASFIEPRFFDGNYLNILAYAKVALKYIGPTIETELSSSLKFFQPNTESNEITPNHPSLVRDDVNKIRPGKDSFKVEAEFRAPLERILENPKWWSWLVSPMVRGTWETSIWPNIFMTSLPVNQWPSRVNDTRLFLGISGKPMVGDEIFRIGALIDYDLSRSTAIQSIAFGGEVAAGGKWNLGPVVLKLETSLRNIYPVVFPEQGRQGLIWLADGKIELPIYGDFSVSALLNVTAGSMMHQPTDLLVGVMCGLALSYGNRLKWLL